MVAEDFVRDPHIRKWLDEPVWTLLTFDSLRAHHRSLCREETRRASGAEFSEVDNEERRR
jgi:hypothetical protein